MSQLNTLLEKADKQREVLLSISKEQKFFIYKQLLLSNQNEPYTLACERILSLAKEESLSITEELLQELHSILTTDSNHYRLVKRIEKKSGYQSPLPEDLPHIMHHLADQYSSSKTTLHPIELSAMMYKRILDIQPFMEIEANQTIAFLIMNLILLHYGYTPAIILEDQKEVHDKTLMESRIHYDMEPFCIFIANTLLRSLNDMIKELS